MLEDKENSWFEGLEDDAGRVPPGGTVDGCAYYL